MIAKEIVERFQQQQQQKKKKKKKKKTALESLSRIYKE